MKLSKKLIWGAVLILICIIIYLFYTSLNKKSILQFQKKLFASLNINSKINFDETIITTDNNISEETFHKLSFVTNNPKYGEVPMKLIDFKVFINGNLTPVKGLFNIVKSYIDYSDKKAFNENKEIHYPFVNGFKNNKTIGTIVDENMEIPLYGKKTFQFILDPTVRIKPKLGAAITVKNAGAMGNALTTVGN